MSQEPAEFTVEIQPRARFDAIDVRSRILADYGDVLAEFPRAYYASLHTTAGYLEQGLASRLARQGDNGVDLYMDAFRLVFPEDAGYEHDKLELRTELSEDQRAVEPRNADSHLAFMASGLRACVSYRATGEPVWFVDLDGVNAGQPRRRQTTVLAYTHEVPVWKTRVTIPVSSHPMDSVNLRDPRIGFYELLEDAIARYGVAKGRLRIELNPEERQAGLTVNEYETLLMRHDLMHVLHNPLKFVAEKGRHAWADPRSIPAKTLDYAKYRRRARPEQAGRRPGTERERDRAGDGQGHGRPGRTVPSFQADRQSAGVRHADARPWHDRPGDLPEPHPGSVEPRLE